MRINFGKICRQLRASKGISLAVMAESINCSKSVISAWETGVCFPTLDRFIRVAKYFNVSFDFLAGLTYDDKVDVG